MSTDLTQKAKDSLREVQQSVSELKADLLNSKTDVKTRLDRLNQLVENQKYARESLKDLSAFPGIKQPKWYSVDIDFEYGDTETKRGEALISADSAFVCTQVQSYYVIRDSDVDHYPGVGLYAGLYTAEGRVLPNSMYSSNIGQAYIFSLDILSTYGQNIGSVRRVNYGFASPEFDFQIEVEGTGRYWASENIPACMFLGGLSPFYLGYEGVVENSDRLVVYADPTKLVPLKGTVRFIFHGYSISSKLSSSALLGLG